MFFLIPLPSTGSTADARLSGIWAATAVHSTSIIGIVLHRKKVGYMLDFEATSRLVLNSCSWSLKLETLLFTGIRTRRIAFARH